VTPSLAEAVLDALDIAVLRRIGERRYEMCGKTPEFYRCLFPDAEEGQSRAAPGPHRPVFDAFLADAELFFSRNQDGVFSACLWREKSGQPGGSALVASALRAGEDKALILRFLVGGDGNSELALKKSRELLAARGDAPGGAPDQAEEQERKARLDSLASLPAKNTFMASLTEEIKRAAFSGDDLSLLLLDIDDFEEIRDVYGPPAGGALLAGLGDMLRSLVRRDDLTARYGDKEFVVIARHTTQQQSAHMAEKLLTVIAEKGFGPLPPITVSIGCATYRRGESPENFLQRAELARQDAKSNGKNMVRVR
jgi:diguanylate cyclase (GGDEF)-like protein